MPSYTDSHTLSPEAHAATRDTSGTATPYVLLDADVERAAVVVSFGAFPVGEPDAAPVYVEGVVALLLTDDGRGEPVTPDWHRYTYALTVGETLTVAASDAPMPTLRLTASLHVPDSVDGSIYSFRLVTGEHGVPC